MAFQIGGIRPREVATPQIMKEQHPLIHRVALLFGWTEAQLEAALAVLAFAQRLEETRGGENTVQYLKEALRLTKKALAGQPERGVVAPAFIGIDKDGFPKLLPRKIRLAYASGDLMTRRVVNVLLSLYRVIVVPGKLKMWTITAGPSPRPKEDENFSPDQRLSAKFEDVQSIIDWPGACDRFVKKLDKFGWRPGDLESLKWQGPHATNKKGPNGPAMMNCYIDAAGLIRSPSWDTFQNYASYLNQGDETRSPVHLVHRLSAYALRWFNLEAPYYPAIGRISAKLEPAGKVRLFAIPDYWTQTVLKPLHDYLFRVLRVIPTDSTFNQQAGVARAAAASANGVRNFWSFDLSAATDRFPVALQQTLLERMFVDQRAKGFAEQWRRLLVDREYTLGHDVEGYLAPDELAALPVSTWTSKRFVKYAVGQPMGAYSSWAAFALSHHAMVQLAAERAGWTDEWFEDYAILGDDVVFWGDTPEHAKVASEYLDLCKLVQVDVNLGKSLVSTNGTFEFALNLVADGFRLTPFHWMEWDRGFASEANFAEFVKTMTSRDVVVTPSRAIAAYCQHKGFTLRRARDISKPFGRGPWWLARLAILLFSPTGPYPMTVKSWCQVLSISLRDLGATNVAWSAYPWVGKLVTPLPNENTLIPWDKDLTVLRRVLFSVWEKSAASAASTLAPLIERRREWLQAIWNDVLDRKGVIKNPNQLEAMFSIHPVTLCSERIWREEWHRGLPHVYSGLIESGMQTAGWWLSEDLPDGLDPGEMSRLLQEKKNLPIEEYLRNPTPEVRALSLPRVPVGDDDGDIRWGSNLLIRLHKALGKELGDLERLRNLRQDSPAETVKLQPTTPVVRPMTTAESWELYEAAYGHSPRDAHRYR